jgi:hypothetical protein
MQEPGGCPRRAGVIVTDASAVIDGLLNAGEHPHPARALLGHAWKLRNSLTGYDAQYVALAQTLTMAQAPRRQRVTRYTS